MLPIRNPRRWAAAAFGAAALVGSVIATNPASAAATNYPIQPNEGSAIGVALYSPETPPPGVNNYSCQLTAAHPRPVILLNGTFSVMENDYGAIGPILANDGYCVFSLNYGAPFYGSPIQSVGAVPASASAAASLIDNVRSHYGNSTQVDLVGHSQGGLVAEYIAKVLGYSAKIHTIVGLSPTTHGTTESGATTFAQTFPGFNQGFGYFCQACVDQEAGSSVVNTVDNGPIAMPGVSYTILETTNEQAVTPVGSSFINEPGVSNIYVQNVCSADTVDHGNLSYDNTTIRLTLNALDPSTATAPLCSQTYPASAVQQ